MSVEFDLDAGIVLFEPELSGGALATRACDANLSCASTTDAWARAATVVGRRRSGNGE
jgi:hypothetical protein